MKLATRLLLYGAVLPLAGLAAAFLVGGLVFDHQMHRWLDRALMAQAAVESVSIFDAADGVPHLHLPISELASGHAAGAPAATALYDPSGALVARFPEDLPAAPRIVPRPLGAEPLFATVALEAGRLERQLDVSVRSPEGTGWTLRLAAPLDTHRQALTTFRGAVGLVGLAVMALLFAVQAWHSRWLGRRVQALAAHMARLREGDLAHDPAPDGAGDVLSELRDAVADATRQLRAAREREERFAAEAAHELRTPLAAMRAEIDVTLRRERPADELRAALGDVREEVDRLSELASRLLDLATVRAGRAASVPGDLRPLVEAAVAAAAPIAEARRVRVAVQAPAAAPLAFEPTSLRQAVDNLLANAVKYSPEGGTVAVRVAGDQEGWRIAVEDEGPGVDDAQRASIFEPFHKAPGSRAGAGLGLAIVCDVARRHGGRAYVTGRDGPGARFVLELPRVA